MDVFLVPGGEGRYELYCEPREVEQIERGGLAGRLLRRLRELMASEQAERESGARPAAAQTGWVARAKARSSSHGQLPRKRSSSSSQLLR